MARRLSFQKFLLGLALSTTAVDLTSATAQSTPQDSTMSCSGKAEDPPTTDKPKDKDHHDNKRDGDKRDGDKRDDNKRDGDKRDDNRRDGDRGRRGPGGILEMIKANPDFLLEMGKRNGGPLELLALLMKPEVRKELGLAPEHATAADKFVADMTKRFEDDINAIKQKPDANFKEMFDKRLEAENKEFEKLLASLPPDQRDRLIGIFVQMRNLRSLSNRVIAMEKLGMTPEQADELRSDIHHIRMETFREMDDRARQVFANRGMVQPSDQLRKMRNSIDHRIKKLVTKEQLDKLSALRGKELPAELLEQLDRPPAPPAQPEPSEK